MLGLPPLEKCYFVVPLADVAKKKPLGRIDDVVIMVNNNLVCGDPGLAIRNTRYAYNSRSHDQCVMNPHIRVDNRITSSITVPK
jgi:hypothetical protein